MSSKKRSKSWLGILVKGFLLLISPFLIYTAYYFYVEYKSGFIHYKEFGIKIPTKYVVHGVDVSHHNGVINWNALKAMQVEKIALKFAFIKATEGKRHIDSKFFQNWLRAHNSGVVCGAYHYFQPNTDAQKQADNFIRVVKLSKGDLPPVLDVEEYTGNYAEMRKNVLIWLKIVENHYGVRPILYTGADFYKNYLGESFDKYPLWVAHYHKGDVPRIDRKWHFWQHSEEGRVDGVKYPIDFNVFNGSINDFHKIRIK